MERKKNYYNIILSVLVMICMLLPIPVFASSDTGAIVDQGKKANVYIDYAENIDGNDPVANAEFTLYKVGELLLMGNYRSIIPGIDTINADTNPDSIVAKVQSVYAGKQITNGYMATKVTDKQGKASFENLDLGLYLLVETRPAIEHFTSIPTLVSVPHTDKTGTYWEYDVTIEPKSLPCGDLIVEKTVTGDNGEKTRDFHFKLQLAGYDDPVHYTKTGNVVGTLKSGDTFTLKDGERIIFDTIPVGTAFVVSEEEANADGYVTTIDNGTGNIRRTVQSLAHFYNTRRNAVDTGDSNIVFICLGICLISSIIAIFLYDKLRGINKKGFHRE